MDQYLGQLAAINQQHPESIDSLSDVDNSTSISKSSTSSPTHSKVSSGSAHALQLPPTTVTAKFLPYHWQVTGN